jgi:hypothetical protein
MFVRGASRIRPASRRRGYPPRPAQLTPRSGAGRRGDRKHAVHVGECTHRPPAPLRDCVLRPGGSTATVHSGPHSPRRVKRIGSSVLPFSDGTTGNCRLTSHNGCYTRRLTSRPKFGPAHETHSSAVVDAHAPGRVAHTAGARRRSMALSGELSRLSGWAKPVELMITEGSR